MRIVGWLGIGRWMRHSWAVECTAYADCGCGQMGVGKRVHSRWLWVGGYGKVGADRWVEGRVDGWLGVRECGYVGMDRDRWVAEQEGVGVVAAS